MELLGYSIAIIIGIIIGLIGGGGSSLTLPVLLYLFGVDIATASAYTTIIVGITSGIGCYEYYRGNFINAKTAIVFGVPSIIGVYFSRAFLIPNIPDVITITNKIVLSKDLLILSIFVILLMTSATSMLRKSKVNTKNEYTKVQKNYILLVVLGLAIGIITGIVGVGGGFIIIPTLVVLLKMPMKKAIGTALAIVTLKSLIGILGEPNLLQLKWTFLGTFMFFTFIGVIIGTYTSKRIDGAKLKPIFGWIILILGIGMLIKEILFSNL